MLQVAHEEWWTMYKYYFERRRDLVSDWTRDRAELLNRAKVVFSEVVVAKELAEHKEEFRQKQQEFCDALYSRVQYFINEMFYFMVEEENLWNNILILRFVF